MNLPKFGNSCICEPVEKLLYRSLTRPYNTHLVTLCYLNIEVFEKKIMKNNEETNT